MNLIKKIFSTLKTWVFKNKLLKFSSRFERDPLACFYCPEMCRFSCNVAETIRSDTVTPRGKMSLLHLIERGITNENVIGSKKDILWTLDQCTGCGRCTEYCLHEVDGASALRKARQKILEAEGPGHVCENLLGMGSDLEEFGKRNPGDLLLTSPGRLGWWQSSGANGLISELGVSTLLEGIMPDNAWSRGEKIDSELLRILRKFLEKRKIVWVESPQQATFLVQGVGLKNVRHIWQRLAPIFFEYPLGVDEFFHESFHLTRLLPKQGLSIPVYDRGQMPLHVGWNVFDCGGEGHFRLIEPKTARNMAKRFLDDLLMDNRKVSRIVCHSLNCQGHLLESFNGQKIEIQYWLDRMVPEVAQK